MRTPPCAGACAVLAAVLSVHAPANASTCARPPSAVSAPTAGNCLYDVVVSDRTGAFSAGTGVEHPVTQQMISTFMGGRQTLALGGGRALGPELRCASIRSWDS